MIVLLSRFFLFRILTPLTLTDAFLVATEGADDMDAFLLAVLGFMLTSLSLLGFDVKLRNSDCE